MLPSTDPELLLSSLDPEQREVATSLQGQVAVLAGAGTGKTRAITHRIAYGVARGVYRPNAVLAVTFTTRAAGEMRGRLQQLGAHGVQARTFHSAALRQAQYFWPRVHGGDLPSVLDNRMSVIAEAASRLRLRVETGTLRDLVGEIAWAKVSNVSADDYPRLAPQLGRELASFDAETVARVFSSYEQLKRDRGRIDFEDILLCAASLISDHPQVAEQVRGTYRHLVVDEYQDVSPLQEALLTLWRGERHDLCVVGDPAQTIHSFAGARASYLTEFTRRNPDAKVIKLVRDYRSTPEVVQAANKIMDGSRRTGPGEEAQRSVVTLTAQQPSGPAVQFARAGDEASEAAGVADWLAGLAAEGVDPREMAVLFRINAQSPLFEQALADRGIPYLVRGAERFYERLEVRQALLTIRTEARNQGGADDEPDGPDTLARVKAVLSTVGWTAEAPTGAGAVRERWESLAALVSVAEDLVAAADAEAPATLADVAMELDRRAEAQHVPTAQGVTLSTIHSAKGLEWEAVAVVGAHEGTLPFVLAQTPPEVAEERRLLYVAVTRAKRHLRISWSQTRSGSGNQRSASRFLDGVRPAGQDSDSERRPKRQRKQRRSAMADTCRSCGKSLHDGSERKLGRHTDCPSTYDEDTLAVLREWRRQEASSQSLPAYCIFTDATLVAVAEARPSSEQDLLRIHGLGRTKADKYGDAVLAIVASEGTDGAAAQRLV
ncbi:MAG: ATP-dependent DNA helicase UvrD2 [Propionibacteriaceae bacterium]